jgi:hypothetical protein
MQIPNTWWRNVAYEALPVSASEWLRRIALDIPNDLNKLIARLQEVTRGTGGTAQTSASGPRPNEVEVDFFLSQYNFDQDAVIERIEISKDDVFEFYLFAVWNRRTQDLSLLAMWPQSRNATERPVGDESGE